MMQLIRTARRNYVSIVRKYPDGLGNRMERFDEWTKTWNDPNVTSYYDFFYNFESRKFEAYIPDSDSAKNELAQCAARHRPVIAELSDKLNIKDNYYSNDNLLSIDVAHLSFRRFVREGLSQETRTDVHRFFLWLSVSVVMLAVTFYDCVIREDHKQQVVHLEPDPNFYRYNPNLLEYEVKAFIEKINMLNSHSQDVLIKAKERAEQRQQAKAVKSIQKGKSKQ